MGLKNQLMKKILLVSIRSKFKVKFVKLKTIQTKNKITVIVQFK